MLEPPPPSLDAPLPDDLHRLAPGSAQFQTDSRCNGRCVMCPYATTRSTLPQGRMPWPLVERVVDELASVESIRSISPMLQNEPLLDERLPRVVQLIKARRPDLHVGIASNGALLDRSAVDRLVDAGLDSLIFSLNALTRETFEVVEPGLSFDRVMANLEDLVERRPPGLEVAVRAKVVRPSLVELAVPSRFSDLPARLAAAGIPFGASAISNRAGALEGYRDLVVLEHTQASKRKRYCHDPFEAVNVLQDGTVIACCADWTRRSRLGSLTTESLREVWNGERARSFREAVAAGAYDSLDPCGGCNQAWNIVGRQRTGE